MPFYCSDKFRMNGNNTRLDVWLIYKCEKCDTTLKLTIKRGIKPHDIPREMFDAFTHNDAEYAWKYAFDRGFLKSNACTADYANVEYRVEGCDLTGAMYPLTVHVTADYHFGLKLTTLLAGVLGISINALRKMVDVGYIETVPPCEITKRRIYDDFVLVILRLRVF